MIAWLQYWMGLGFLSFLWLSFFVMSSQDLFECLPRSEEAALDFYSGVISRSTSAFCLWEGWPYRCLKLCSLIGYWGLLPFKFGSGRLSSKTLLTCLRSTLPRPIGYFEGCFGGSSRLKFWVMLIIVTCYLRGSRASGGTLAVICSSSLANKSSPANRSSELATTCFPSDTSSISPSSRL